MNKSDGSIVGCERELKNGHTCGVQPIGRCATCERAFCLTHQGRERDSVFPYVDMWAPCLTVKQAEDAKRAAESRAPYEYFESGTARSALLISGVQPAKIYDVQKRLKEGFFITREVKDVTLIGHGWILGEFEWEYSVPVQRGNETIKKNWLTALLDLSPDDQRLRYHSSHNSTLARVQPYSGGYELVLGWGDRFVGSWQYGQGWREVAQAVKRLTGESS